MTVDSSLTPVKVDDALDRIFLDATDRILRHDSRTDPQGYAALVHALKDLVVMMSAMKTALIITQECEDDLDG